MTKRELHERLRLAAARLDWNSGVHVVGTRTVLEPFLTEVRRLQREAERR